MNKKGNIYWIVGIFFGVLILIAIVVTMLILALQKGKTDNNEIEGNFTEISVFLKAVDSQTKQQVKANYMIFDKNLTLLSEGETDEDVRIETKIKKYPIQVMCWNENHYANPQPKEISNVEIQLKSSAVDCSINEISELDITFTEFPNTKEGVININLNSENFRQISGVLSWTSGIILAEMRLSAITCSGNWTNSSLIQNGYSCGNLYLCNNITTNKENKNITECNFTEPIPSRFEKIRNSFTTQANGNYEFNLYVKTADDIDSEDYIQIIFYDKDLRFNGKKLEYISELNGEDIGGRDYPIRIYYEPE